TFSQLPQHLNIKHTIFGQLTGGFDIFNRLIQTPVASDGSGRPNTPVVINRTEVFTDSQNGVLRISSTRGSTSSATGTVTATGGGGLTASQALNVRLVPNTADGTATGTAVNDKPFLGPVNNQVTRIGQAVTFNLAATDFEGDNLTFAVRTARDF